MVSKKAQKAQAKATLPESERLPALLRHFLTRQTLSKAEIIQALELAFAGVVLGEGISLRQAQVWDDYGETPLDLSDPEAHVVDDWRSLPRRELDRDNVAHLDPLGWRYYWPALAIALLEDYENEQYGLADLRIISTLTSLDIQAYNHDYYQERYAILTRAQKCAIALYLQHLPAWVTLGTEDVHLRRRALRNYWGQFLSEANSLHRS